MSHLYYNATTVSIDGIGILIEGAEKSGKSSLALFLIEMGGKIISDDLTFLSIRNNRLFAQEPNRCKSMIAVRGLGIIDLKDKEVNPVEIKALVRLSDTEGDFSLKQEYVSICGIDVKLFNFRMYDFALTTKLKAVIKILKNEWSLVETL